MDFMKVFDQTVREIKREVNLKVLKVPEIEQKVLDATDDEPWGPHGTALAEIAQATKKFTECQMVMNVLWTRLSETGKDWRFVYKSLAVIEYLVSHGSERAVDDIIEHTFQISSLASFEYVEPSGKDLGINVRKKAENIVALLNDKDKIQQVRNKAAANRDKYVGLSSSGITFKSGNASFSSSSNFSSSSDRYGGFGSSQDDDYSYKPKKNYDEDKFSRNAYGEDNDFGKTSKMSSSRNRGKDRDVAATKSTTKLSDSDKYSSTGAQSSSAPSNNYEDDFDDFDPRGSDAKPATANQVDLFGESLVGDLLDVAPPITASNFTVTSNPPDVDLFADAAFVSAPSQPESVGSFPDQSNDDLFASQTPPHAASSATNVDLFASQANPSPVSSTFDFFAAPSSVTKPDDKSSNSVQMASNTIDPFAAVPLNNFDSSDPFGGFTSHTEPETSATSQSVPNVGSDASLNGLADTKSPPKKDNFQVKSGIWADSLTRGLIDLNIAAPKKVNLADVGVVGGLTDGTEVNDKGPIASWNMGRAMGGGTGLGISGYGSTATGDDDGFFSSLSNNSQQYQFGNFQK
ncbi:hypothetical protein Leryth_009068 [Lithospermum erythrorhizon]|nr:hypothetical protein Leryth_009068 [Lithospermum erythrorhizon]